MKRSLPDALVMNSAQFVQKAKKQKQKLNQLHGSCGYVENIKHFPLTAEPWQAEQQKSDSKRKRENSVPKKFGRYALDLSNPACRSLKR